MDIEKSMQGHNACFRGTIYFVSIIRAKSYYFLDRLPFPKIHYIGNRRCMRVHSNKVFQWAKTACAG